MKRPRLSGRQSLKFQQKADGNRWVDRVGPLRCSVTYLRGGESVISGRLAGVNTCVVRARATAVVGVSNNWRIKDAVTNQVFDIKSFLITSDRRWVDFTCQTEMAT